MATSQIELIYLQIKALNLEDKLRLIEWMAKELQLALRPIGKGLVYGEYKDNGRRMSTEEDFKIAEWNPTDAELDGE